MKVLSLLQPWASLVVMGHKKIETRSWKTKYRGELLIHASLNPKMAKELCELGGTDHFRDFIRHWTDLPFGAIIGKVNLLYTSPTETLSERLSQKINILIEEFLYPNLPKQELAFGDYSPGRHGWLLSDPVQFKTPTPVKGNLSLWEFDEDNLINK